MFLEELIHFVNEICLEKIGVITIQMSISKNSFLFLLRICRQFGIINALYFSSSDG